MAIGILSALIARDRHGIGQRVEVDLYSSTLNAMSQENFVVLNQGVDLERAESGTSTAWNDAPYGVYPTKDGWIAIAMCPLPTIAPLVEAPEVVDWDPWTERDRVKWRIEEGTRARTTDDWMTIFGEADIWASPVRTSRQAMNELVDSNSDLLVRFEYPGAGELKAIACPIKLSETPADLRYPSPTIGQHTDQILTEILSRNPATEAAE